jgi:putative oxidoreductase
MALLDLIWRREPPGRIASLGLLGLRLVAGSAFVIHGWSKAQHPFSWMGAGSQMPALLQGLATLSEFGGGIAWILGLLVPLASFGIVCTMGVAVAKHLQEGAVFVGKGKTYELALLYGAIALLFALVGPGRFSLDARLARPRRP